MVLKHIPAHRDRNIVLSSCCLLWSITKEQVVHIICIYVIYVSSLLLAADLYRTLLFLGKDLWKGLMYKSRNYIAPNLLLVWVGLRDCEQKQIFKWKNIFKQFFFLILNSKYDCMIWESPRYFTSNTSH